MRPDIFDLQLAPGAVFIQRKNPHACVQPSGNIGVHLDGNFAVPSLGFDHARQSHEVIRIQTGHGFALINTDSK